MKKHTLIYLILTLMLSIFSSCTSIPKGVEAVGSFEKGKYLGKWYEIARFDFKFEKGLNNTTAEYSLLDDGKIEVLNKGFDYERKEWRQSVGKAKFIANDDKAMLKVSFFGPFYAGYNVIAIDVDYKYALVSGDSFDYLWILSREKTIPENIKLDYLKIAEDFGFNTSALLWIEHDK